MRRNIAAETATSWLIGAIVLALLSAAGGFIAFGNAFPTEEYFAGEGTFGFGAAFGGAVVGFLVMAPWIGLFDVLRRIAERVPASADQT